MNKHLESEMPPGQFYNMVVDVAYKNMIQEVNQ